MTAIELSSYAGLAAMTLLTFNILIGLVMSVKYNPVRNWPHRRWKSLHFTAYGTAALFYVHGILTDPNLKDAPIDFLDGEKVYVELCMLLVIAAAAVRLRWQLRQPPPRVHRHKTSRPTRTTRAGPASLRLEDPYVDVALGILLDVGEQRIHPLQETAHIVISAGVVE